MLLTKIDENNLSDEDINKILFDIPIDDRLPGECIWVFGSWKSIDERTNLAVKLFKNNRAPYILFSGGKKILDADNKSEAILMKEKAISLGVPEDRILIEDDSTNTTENILCSLIVLERKFLLQKIERLIVVTSPFHIQRLSLTLSRYMPRWINYSYCYDENSNTSKSNWRKDESSRIIVEEESKSIIYYAKNKYIDDKEIDL